MSKHQKNKKTCYY